MLSFNYHSNVPKRWCVYAMSYKIKCSNCGKLFTDLLYFKCPSCESPLEVKFNIDFNIKKIQRKKYNVWRYSNFFPYIAKKEIITLGEGWTPLVKFSDNVMFKMESLNPTGSFKDRGSTVLISAIHKQVKKAGGSISEDSSGNAGASIAAYAAHAGLRAKIYVPKDVSGAKFSQIQYYGVEVAKIQGSRSKVAEQAQKRKKRKFYVGHILQPLFRDGIRSLAYEIGEQLNWQMPRRVYLPVSAGTLLLGVINGFKHLTESNIIDTPPEIIACQTRQVSPLYHRFKNLPYKPPKKVTSIADALVSVNPPLLDLMVKNLKEIGGNAVMVEEEEIYDAFKTLARKGFFVEPSSAVAYVAYQKQLKNKEASKSEKIVVVLTGTGLKTATIKLF